MTRTFCFASSATVTLGVVNNGNVIYEMYCVVGTEFLANAATDTTRFTHIHNLSALALSTASDVNLCVFGNAFDEFFGTSFYTNAATHAKSGIYLSVTVSALDSEIRASVNATAGAHATHFTLLATVS